MVTRSDIRRVWRAAALCLLSGIAQGAASEGVPASSPALVWPPPPAEPRVRYVRSISSPADIGARPSIWGRMASAITGTRKGAERLVKPMGIAVDDSGSLCVTDTGSGTVCLFDLAARRFSRWDAIGKVRLVSPVAVAKKGDVLYVADSALGKVLAFDIRGKPRFEIASVERPTGVAVLGEKLFVADSQAHAIAVFDLAGSPLYRFGARGAGPGEFNAPTHVAATADGRLLVTDSLNGRIQVFSADGLWQRTIGSPGDGTGHFSRPKGVAADSFGHIYAVDALHDNVQVFDGEGRFLMDWGEAGSKPGEFWLPAGVAVSRQNEIFVVDSYNRRVQVFQYVGQP